MGWLFTNLISAFLLPPLNLILIGAAGLLLIKRRPRLGKSLLALSLGLLMLLSTPLVSGYLISRLENSTPPATLRQADAIVVLGGGRQFAPVKADGETVSQATLERLRYAALLHRNTGKPILVSGGKPDGGRTAEGELMRQILENDFHTPVKWVEDRSDNTYENAAFSFDILKKDGIRDIYLITQAWHLPRSVITFERAGFRVIPAPAGMPQPGYRTPLDLLPNAYALGDSRTFLHEAIGMAWYRLRGLVSRAAPG
jgi:uncharacterized SAM-binding protein YcdF (DUF218 family)